MDTRDKPESERHKVYVRHVWMVTSVGTRDRATAHLKFQYKTHVSQALGIKLYFLTRLCKTESKSFSQPPMVQTLLTDYYPLVDRDLWFRLLDLEDPEWY